MCQPKRITFASDRYSDNRTEHNKGRPEHPFGRQPAGSLAKTSYEQPYHERPSNNSHSEENVDLIKDKSFIAKHAHGTTLVKSFQKRPVTEVNRNKAVGYVCRDLCHIAALVTLCGSYGRVGKKRRSAVGAYRPDKPRHQQHRAHRKNGRQFRPLVRSSPEKPKHVMER